MQSIIIIAVAVVALVLTVVGIMSFIARNYIKVAPNQVAVFYGRKYKTKDGQTVGFKVVTGGAKFKVPIVESVQMLDLSIFSIDLQVKSAPNKDGVPVNLEGVANVKILSDESSLMSACERFLHKTPAEIKDIAFKNLEGHLRAIAGGMTIEELVGDRSKLNQAVLNDATTDLKKLGLGVDLLTIQKVTDDTGYIEQLGKKRTAEVTKDAAIGKATAEKESKIQTTTAEKEAALTENENLVKVAESEKNREVQKAVYAAETSKQQAIAAQATPLATAEEMKKVVTAEQEMEKTKVEKETEVAVARVKKTEQDLESTVVKPAEAAKKAAVLAAEQSKEVKILEAEGEKEKATKEGEGIAAAIKAKLVAEAEGNKAKGLAEAEVVQAKLLAEAEGISKKAEAYEKLDASGRLLLILEVLERVAPQIVKEFAGVMEAAAKPLSNVDNISIVDFGNGDATGKFGGTVPGMIAKLLSTAAASGIDLSGLTKKFGIDVTKLLQSANIKNPADSKGDSPADTSASSEASEEKAEDKK
jgi:flotillin